MNRQLSTYVRRGIAATALAGAATLFAANSAFALPGEEEWQQDVAAAVAPAQSYLEERLPADGAAIVLDIDNTSLATDYDRGAPIEPTLNLANFAKEQGASIQFVTNRRESGRKSTLRELRRAGFPVDGLCMRQEGDDSSKEEMKTNCRIGIENQGFKIVANIGNRETDLIGGHAERTFKLPDYDGELQ